MILIFNIPENPYEHFRITAYPAQLHGLLTDCYE